MGINGRTLNVKLVGKDRAWRSGYQANIDSFRDLEKEGQKCGVTQKEKSQINHLPRFDENAHPRPHKDHPTRVLIIIDEIQEDDKLDHDVGDDLLYREET
jgi:hypothetical protein